MKTKSRIAFKLLLALTMSITLGCGVISQIFPTPTPVPTSTPTVTPSPTPTLTPTATLTPTPMPDISAARIFLEELPAGFEELPSDDISGSPITIGENAWESEETFIFVNAKKFQMIIGTNFFIVDQMDRAGFDIAMSQPDVVLKQIVKEIGTENVREEKILDGLQDVGDERVAMTMIADMENTTTRMEILLFRRDIISGIIVSITVEGQDPNISLHDLGKLFDQHIQEALQ